MSHLWDTIQAEEGALDWGISTPDEVDNPGGFQDLDPLQTAIILSLFTDRRIPGYMLEQFGFKKTEQEEWHGNLFDMQEGEAELGSWLWLLRRAPLTPQTQRLAEHFASVALQPIVRQKIVSGFDITSEIDKVRGVLALRIRTIGPQIGERLFFFDLWPLQ